MTEPKRLAPLDGLRGLAILMVLWCHLDGFLVDGRGLSEPSFVHLLARFGFAGVFLFFVLSGFLLFLPYARALIAGSPWPSVRRFYQRRVLRILPLYWLVLAFLLFVVEKAPLNWSLLLAPLLLFDLHTQTFNQVSALDPPLWTLAVEWQFYLLLPWIALALAKLAGRRTGQARARYLILGLALLTLLGLLIRVLVAVVFYAWNNPSPLDAPGVMGPFLTLVSGMRGKQLEIFTLGIGASLFYVWAIEQGHLTPASRSRVSFWTGAAALLGLAGAFWLAAAVGRIPAVNGIFVPQAPVWFIVGEWLLGISFALLLLSVMFGVPWVQRVWAFRPLCFIGLISYSLYLWHWQLLALSAYSTPLALLVLLLFCTASYYLVERPFLRWRHASTSKPLLSASFPRLGYARVPEQPDLRPGKAKQSDGG